MLELAQQLVSMTEGLFHRTYFEPVLIAFFGLTLILGARVISRITAFVTLHKTEHLPETRTESVVEIRLGEVPQARGRYLPRLAHRPLLLE